MPKMTDLSIYWLPLLSAFMIKTYRSRKRLATQIGIVNAQESLPLSWQTIHKGMSTIIQRFRILFRHSFPCILFPAHSVGMRSMWTVQKLFIETGMVEFSVLPGSCEPVIPDVKWLSLEENCMPLKEHCKVVIKLQSGYTTANLPDWHRSSK